MDTKITLSFDESIINKAKSFAEQNNISVSRLVEFLLSKTVHSNYPSLDELPVADWISMVSEGEVEYQRKPVSNKTLKKEYYTRSKSKK